jgi:DNA-binding CsgD family transcriptional regulator
MQRLAQLCPALSGREREVLAWSAIGLTSEGIALQLNIGLNTVQTYRKRAYRRLSISSQNELMHRLML